MENFVFHAPTEIYFGKGQIEKAFFTLTNNLVNAIKQESEMMQKEFQEELMRMRKDSEEPDGSN